MGNREAHVTRKTRETEIELTLRLDGAGAQDIATGIDMLDHLLTSLAKHAGFDLQLRCTGDLHVDDHHTAEDCALALGQALEQVQSHVGVLVGHSMNSMQKPTEIYKTGLHTNALLESLSEVTIAWLLLEHAEVASAALADTTGDDVAFYEGKIASAKFFVNDALPKVTLRTEAAQTEDGWLMELSDAAF